MSNRAADNARATTRLKTDLPICGARVQLVRFEDSSGDGLFGVANVFEDYFESRAIRLNRKVHREVEALFLVLRNSTPIPDLDAYRDELSRRPVTWFRASAHELLRIAERLVRILNRFGADIRRFETDRPPPILWQDMVQVVTRRPRGSVRERMSVLECRRIERRKRLARTRARAARRRVRRLKSGL